MSKFFEALEQAEHDRTLRRSADLAPLERTSTRAQAPTLEALEATAVGEVSEPIDQHLVSLLRPTSYEAEQYRTLRHVIERAHLASGLQIIGVSSPGSRDGKTLTAINLAGALAQGPRARVLVIDFDLRHPTVASYLALAVNTGLAEAILTPHLTLEQVVQIYPTFNLAVLPVRRPLNATYEVLNSGRCTDVIDAARRKYDYVVLDLPPLTPVPDCRILQHSIDGFLVVVAAHKTPRKLLESALDAVSPEKMMGLIFNGVDRSSGGYAYPTNEHAARRGGPRHHRWFRRFRATATQPSVGD
jgi:protein-tyrosine kinase